MKYIIPQEKNIYGVWQSILAVSSLLDLKVDQEDIYIILGNYGYNKEWADFKIRFPKVNVHEYRNHSVQSYKPAVKPYLLWQFFKEFDYLAKEQWFLMDNDILLTKRLTKKRKGVVHLSDCSIYMNLDYLRAKGYGLAEGMANRVKMDFSIVEANDKNTGGAQYVFDNISWETWKMAYEYSVILHRYLGTNKDTFNRLHSENCVQVWCAEMWGVLWAIWNTGNKTVISKDMDFHFATDKIAEVKKKKIIHHLNRHMISFQILKYEKKENIYTREPARDQSKQKERCQRSRDNNQAR